MKTIIIALLVMLSAYTTYYWIQDEGWKDWGGKNSERALERAKKEKALTETAGVSGDLSRLFSDVLGDLDVEIKNVPDRVSEIKISVQSELYQEKYGEESTRLALLLCKKFGQLATIRESNEAKLKRVRAKKHEGLASSARSSRVIDGHLCKPHCTHHSHHAHRNTHVRRLGGTAKHEAKKKQDLFARQVLTKWEEFAGTERGKCARALAQLEELEEKS